MRNTDRLDFYIPPRKREKISRFLTLSLIIFLLTLYMRDFGSLKVLALDIIKLTSLSISSKVLYSQSCTFLAIIFKSIGSLITS